MPVIRNISFSYREYSNPEELDPEDRELVSLAKEAAKKAYAPYSGFMVGAVVRLESGRKVTGANVENAAFPSGICAERTALSSSVSNYPDDKPVTVAIAAMTADGTTPECVSPCGNCRQVIAEEEMRTGRQIRIILSGEKNIMVIDSVRHLLPLQFSRDNLKSNLPV
jgi:cytidine deaminase